MDYDRRSAVSSFYGGRKNSLDALNADFPSPTTPQYGQPARPRPDDASSFYNGGHNPRESLMGGGPSAGYNRMSFFQPGREEPVKGAHDEESVGAKNDGFDIYADFNNEGPRYSTAFGTSDAGYRQVPSPSPLKLEDDMSSAGPVELVTVPALGPEWKASELRNMTKAAKRERQRESFHDKWVAWNRGEIGCCGPYFTRRFTVYFLFGSCIVAGIILAFTIPRVPSFSFSQSPLVNATAPFNHSISTGFSRSPANFSFPAAVNIEMDTSGNFIPLVITRMEATVLDLQTGFQVGSGNLSRQSFPAKKIQAFQFPLDFSYVGTNDTDQTWVNWYNACKNPALYPNGSRPPLQFNLVIDMWIQGLIGQRNTQASVTEANCPITLSQNSV
ncbi:hypothetical protein B0H21DRAFT_821912 [Amylocystis lapponica]|nr:hypothetical protein B0H21DRAFT_821912 [Amylocystis lapponica]